jgi:hypothetical protein
VSSLTAHKSISEDRQDFPMAKIKARKEDVSERDVPEPDKKINGSITWFSKEMS